MNEQMFKIETLRNVVPYNHMPKSTCDQVSCEFRVN